MGATVTINITNNCGCCGGGSGSGSGSGSSSSTPGVSVPAVIDPTDENGPPQGYTEATDLSDRQCRAAIWIYRWIYDTANGLANTGSGNVILNLLQSHGVQEAIKSRFVIAFTPVVVLIITAICGALSISVPQVAVMEVITGTLAGFLVYHFLDKYAQAQISVVGAQRAVAKLPEMQDEIICLLSKATDSSVCYEDYQLLLGKSEYGLSDAQQTFLVAVLPPEVLGMLFYSPNWFPSFDEDTLSNITANCCGSFTDGGVITNNSIQECQSAWWLVDKLVAALNGVQDFFSKYRTSGFGILWNPFDDDTDEIYTIFQENAGNYIPSKIILKAADVNQFYRGVAEYVNYQTYGGDNNPLDYNWSNLATYLSDNAATMRQSLREALDVNDAYTAVSNFLFAFIENSAHGVDADLQPMMEKAIDGLIKPLPDSPGVLNLMFYQDGDLAFYKSTECANADPAQNQPSDCGHDVAIGSYDFTGSPYNWELTNYSGSGSAAYVPGVGFKFTPTSGAVQQMVITQQVKHSVRRVRVTFVKGGGDAYLGHIYVNSSDDGVNFGNNSDQLYPTSPYTTNALCINDKYVQVVVNATMSDAFWVSKIEFVE